MELNLHEKPLPQVFTGGISIDHLSWWFWVKAGVGFSLGAGVVYIVSQMLWLVLIYNAPALVFLRAFTR